MTIDYRSTDLCPSFPTSLRQDAKNQSQVPARTRPTEAIWSLVGMIYHAKAEEILPNLLVYSSLWNM